MQMSLVNEERREQGKGFCLVRRNPWVAGRTGGWEPWSSFEQDNECSMHGFSGGVIHVTHADGQHKLNVWERAVKGFLLMLLVLVQ